LAERLRLGLSQEEITMPGGGVIVTSSMGIAASDTTAAPDATWLIRAADAALYRAKACGRNRIELATAADTAVNISPTNKVVHT
jgi:diguanylate cyclase (GGDEF)-like protein